MFSTPFCASRNSLTFSRLMCLGTASKAKSTESVNKRQVPQTITAMIRKLVTGSIHWLPRFYLLFFLLIVDALVTRIFTINKTNKNFLMNSDFCLNLLTLLCGIMLLFFFIIVVFNGDIFQNVNIVLFK